MTSGKTYRITKRIKLHTKPLYEADITLTGRYVRESQNFYIFDTFKVKKANVIKIVETAQSRLCGVADRLLMTIGEKG